MSYGTLQQNVFKALDKVDNNKFLFDIENKDKQEYLEYLYNLNPKYDNNLESRIEQKESELEKLRTELLEEPKKELKKAEDKLLEYAEKNLTDKVPKILWETAKTNFVKRCQIIDILLG